MNKPTRVALQGFSRAERSTFESFFALAGQRTPSYAHEAELTRAHFILVDADDERSCALLASRGLMRRAVALGSTARPEALMQLPRPINLMLVVRALDGLPRSAARPRTPSGADPNAMVEGGHTQPSDSIDRVLQALAHRTSPLPGGVDYRARAGSAPNTPASEAQPAVWSAPRTSKPATKAPHGTQTSGVAAPAMPRAAVRADAELAPDLERQAKAYVRPNSDPFAEPFATTEAPNISSVDIPVWADARAIAASLAAQAAAEAWPTITGPLESSAALWLPDLQVNPPAVMQPVVAASPAPPVAPAVEAPVAPVAPVAAVAAVAPVALVAPVAPPLVAPTFTASFTPPRAAQQPAQQVPAVEPQWFDVPDRAWRPEPPADLPFPTLPAMALPGANAPTTATVAQPRTPALRGTAHGAAHEAAHGANVLVVDDGDLALRFITNQLKRYGFQVHVAREPREALAQLQERHHAFVFVEINLEADNDFPVTQAVRQLVVEPGQKAPSVVLLADRHSKSEMQAAASSGAHAWLSTPLLEADLLKLIGPRSPPSAPAAVGELSSAASH